MNGIPAYVRALSALVLLLLAVPAVAQMGPAPGADPLAYAQDHLQDKVDNATADPAGYAASQANPEAVANETGHSLYLACWTAWDQTGMLLPGCEAYFVPPASFDPVAEAAATNDTANVTAVVDGLANETLDIVNDTLADPTSAPSQLERAVKAVVGAAQAVGGFVVALVKGLFDGVVTAGKAIVMLVVATVLSIIDGFRFAGLALASGASAAWQGIVGLVDGVVAGLHATATGLASAGAALGGAVATAMHAVGGAMAAAAGGVADLVSSAAEAVADAGHAVASGLAEAGQAVADVAKSAVDAVQGLFGGDGASGGKDDAAADAVKDVEGTADGLLDGVTDLVPL